MTNTLYLIYLYNFAVVVKLDAFVTSDQTHAELCKALKVSGFPCSTLRIVLEKLDATCLGEQKLNILMQQVNPQVLNILLMDFYIVWYVR